MFAQALAADERSFRFELFEEAAVRLERALIKAPLQVFCIIHVLLKHFFP